MATTVADLIKNKIGGLLAKVGCPVDYALPMEKQVDALLTNDGNNLQRLGTKFPIARGDELPQNLRGVEFNYFLAEPLLREGSLLLDRCLQQRREHDELKTKLFEACIQLDELMRLNDITAKEEEDYHLSKDIAESEKKMLVDEDTSITKVILPKMERVITQSAFSNLAGDNKFLAQEAAYTKEREELVKLQQVKDQQVIKVRSETSDLNIQQRGKTEIYQKARNEVARLVAARRAFQLGTPNGALNFGEQMKPIKARFDNDLLAAYLRLFRAAEGFSKLYVGKYKLNFPTLKDGKELDFDELVTWCQNTNTWLASFLDTQQQVTRSFSLKDLVGTDKFNAGLASSKWQFNLKAEDFFNREFVRMRALAVQIDSGHSAGSWNVAITPPTKAIAEPKDQSHIGTLYLGKINERLYAVMTESSAPPKLYNASPIGEDDWGIEVFKGSTLGISTSGILDIDIHLTVALV